MEYIEQILFIYFPTSFADSDPGPYVFGHLGSGSVSQRYVSGSGSGSGSSS
jgi:hypothetical protein